MTIPLTSRATVGAWLEHPVGGPAVRALLADAGQSDAVIGQIRNLPLQTLVAMSQGRMPQQVVDDLVREANGGVMPQDEPARAPAKRFSEKLVIVTGAASGIGRAVAERIVREGGRVVAVDIGADRLAPLVSASPISSVIAVDADITDEAGIARIVEAAGASIDGLANVAGIMDGMLPLHETSDQVWDRVMAVNVTGSFRLTRAVVPFMLNAGRGAIVNVASEAALRGSAAGTAYTASKHAVVGLTRSAAFLYAPDGVRVNAVAPGPVATAITGEFRSDFGRERLGRLLATIPPVTTAETLASSITWLLSDDSANVTGQILASDGGWSVQ